MSVCVCACCGLLGPEINEQMKGRWQQKEGFQAPSDGTALENEMSLVSMAANERLLSMHIRGHKNAGDQRGQQSGRGRQAEGM